MTMLLGFIIFFDIVVIGCIIYTIYKIRSSDKMLEYNKNLSKYLESYMQGESQGNRILANLSDKLRELDNLDEKISERTLRAIQSSINQHKGKVGELISYSKLASEYRRIIPLGKPIDFIGIGDDYIDFIETKTGSSRLSKEEMHIKKLIENKAIRFKEFKFKINVEK